MTTDDMTTDDEFLDTPDERDALITQVAAVTGAPELAAAAGDLERREEERRRPEPGSDDHFATLGELRHATGVMLDTLQKEIAGVLEYANNGGADADHFAALHGRFSRVERDIDLLSASISFVASKLGFHDELCEHQRRHAERSARGVAE
jgi:hypothetical protein